MQFNLKITKISIDKDKNNFFLENLLNIDKYIFFLKLRRFIYNNPFFL